MLSRNSICFEAICRIYRNSVVSHIRTVLANKYPGDWEERVAAPFKREEWERNRANAQTRRNTGELFGPLKDNADLLDVHHFHNLFETLFDDLFPDEGHMTAGDRKQQKQAILRWAQDIKNLRDPVLGHPTDDDVTREDASRMLDSAKRILESFDTDAAGQVAGWWNSVMTTDSLAGSGLVPEQRILECSTLPSRDSIAPRFVGRQTELNELKHWLNDPYSSSRLLAGDGGKGKTALAYEFALAVLGEPPPDLEAVIWLSAKVRRFDSGQVIDVDRPSFIDLDSALDAVLRVYGESDADKMTEEKKAKICECLSELPALIILDDVDSLDEKAFRETTGFFSGRSLGLKSKLLLTSRRTFLGPNFTEVKGFQVGSEEGIKFVLSYVDMYGLDRIQFPASDVNDILHVCDGSPLFVQDLLRLCKVGETTKGAISRWKDNEGEEARRYALEREFEMLPGSAKKVLLTCALYEGSVSSSEIRAVTDISNKEYERAVSELQNLFLVPKPHLVEGQPRFALNLNTRLLVTEVCGKDDEAQRISTAIKRLTGELRLTPAQRRGVGLYIREAVIQLKLRQHGDAERTLMGALASYPDNPDLHGTLGLVYKAWKPNRRKTDSRRHFERAANLKSSKEDTYWHWSQMELGDAEWTAAALAAEKGLQILGSSDRLGYMAGFARSRLGQDLYQAVQYDRAEQEARRADLHLKRALADVDDLRQGEYQFHSNVHRAIVLNYERLVHISQAQRDKGSEIHFVRLLTQALDRWGNEHPDDSNASSERQRLEYRFPDIGKRVG